MLTNIKNAIANICDAFDVNYQVNNIEEVIHEEFSGFELSTLNETLGKMTRYQQIDLTHPHNRPANMSELTEKFFILVAQEL